MTLNRRKFIAISTAASLAIKGLPLLGASISESVGVSASGGEEEGFPRGDYTPFGYLDNPWHTWDTHRSGVLRSLPGIGFGLYYPAGPGGYFDFKHSEVYEAQLALGFQIGGRNFREPEDFAPGQLHVACSRASIPISRQRASCFPSAPAVTRVSGSWPLTPINSALPIGGEEMDWPGSLTQARTRFGFTVLPRGRCSRLPAAVAAVRTSSRCEKKIEKDGSTRRA